MRPYYSDGQATLYQGDCRDVLRDRPAASVQCVVTSPPYWAQRDYGLAEEGIGLEPTPQAWLAAMVDVMREVRRVLRDDGTVWLNLGDKYAGSGGANNNSGITGRRPDPESDTDERNAPVHYRTAGALRMPSKTDVDVDVGGWTDESNQMERLPPIGYPAKSLMLLPHRLAIALQEDGWIVRADIIWAKPAPMPESVTDRPTSAHEHIWLLTKQGRYFYDAEAVREPSTERASGNKERFVAKLGERGRLNTSLGSSVPCEPDGTGRNLRSVWTMNPQPFPGAHYAVFPEELPRRCILAGTSEKGCCPECGAPWERVVEPCPGYKTALEAGRKTEAWSRERRHEAIRIGNAFGRAPNVSKPVRTVGWRSTCDHGAEPVPCVVLDPFAGTGTTLKVAKALGRHGIGIELGPDYCAMAVKRLPQMAMML